MGDLEAALADGQNLVQFDPNNAFSYSTLAQV
jgi:hypothetical protein